MNNVKFTEISQFKFIQINWIVDDKGSEPLKYPTREEGLSGKAMLLLASVLVVASTWFGFGWVDFLFWKCGIGSCMPW